MNSPFHLLSLNAQGLRNKEKRLRLREYIYVQKVDILFLQETHFTDEMAYRIRIEFDKWDVFHSYGSSASKGCSIFIDKKLIYDIKNSYKDTDGRYLLINILIDETCYTFINIYADNNRCNRNLFFEKLNEVIENNAEGIKIIGGDFNETLSNQDRYNLNKRSDNKPVTALLTLIENYDLVDVWRTTHRSTQQFTWKRKNNSEKSRIDFWLIESNIMPLISKTDIRPACIQYTDHLAISLKILKQNKRGPGFWKFNNMYLKDQNFNSIISNLIKSHEVKYANQSAKTLWELLKLEIKETSIKYAKQQSRKRKERLLELEHCLSVLHGKIDENESQSDNDKQEIIRLENEIQTLYEIKAKGAQVRSRIQFIEEGEKCTNYFLNLEKSRQTRKSITILNCNGKHVSDDYKILEEEVKFYKTLYSSKHPPEDEIRDYLDNTTFSSILSYAEAELCEGEFNLKELSDAVKQMKPNKSPGLDGLTAEFYQFFWPLLGNLLHKCLNECFNDIEMSTSQKIGTLSLIYKKGDPAILENWRPITLLNNDYKIAARTLANRLKQVIHKIVHLDQQGYIQNRFIGFNLRLIQDIIDYTESLQLEGAILFLDFRKAFDTIEWEFLFGVLRKFGFKSNFLRWIKVLYTDCKSCIYNNGHRSETFNLYRGIRQGCPISALLYIIAAEILALNIRNCDEIKGIEVNIIDEIKNLKISQLADDTTLFLKNRNEILTALDIINNFGKHSGLELNKNKTEGMWIGSKKRSNEKVGNISWPNNPIKALGIHFGHDFTECNKLNWDSKLKLCSEIIQTWRKRKLTLYGKIQIIKTLLIPKFTYLFHSLTVPKSIVTKINQMIYGFLWDGKREKVKRASLIGNKLKGGLEMLDLESYITSLKLKWVKSLLSEDEASWKIIPRYYFESIGHNFLVFYYNNDNLKFMNTKTLTYFYKDLLILWTKHKNIKENLNPSFIDIRQQLIWGNKNIKFKGKCLIFNNWIKANIMFINDIVDQNGEISNTVILDKLEDKRNWISEISKLKKAIPNNWKTIIRNDSSRKTRVKTGLKLSFQNIDFLKSTNKDIYKLLIAKKFEDPITHAYWNDKFHENVPWLDVYTFINKIYDNRHKQYKFRTINNIFTTKHIRYKWKMENTPNCPICNEREDYEHVFINCQSVKNYWKKITHIFRLCGIENNIKTLKTIITGYRITNTDYFFVNLILTIVGFSIYKAYFCSENWRNQVDIFKIFIKEFKFLDNFLKYKGYKDPFISKIDKAIITVQFS